MTVIITICSLLLLAYLFDISSVFTKIPTVFLLILLGWGVRKITYLLEIHIPELSSLLPIMGTIGLILIVLESSLELELNKSKLKVIRKSSIMAFIPMLLLAFLIAMAFHHIGGYSLKISLVNAIPFCVISSAIAIPSVKHLSHFNKEFIIYESSLSDIFGVLFFNFIALNELIDISTVGSFFFQVFLIIIASFFLVVGLSFLLSRIKHHITFTPILLLIILIYAVSKVYHLPGLIFILIFGLFLGNLDELENFKWIKKLHPEKLNSEVKKFKEISYEASFITRTLFFILFGFLMDAKEIFNTEVMPWSVMIVALILGIRWFFLKMSGLPNIPLLYISPRGLITILLFLSIIPAQNIPFVNRSLVIQVIMLSVLVMMFGLIKSQEPVELKKNLNDE